MPEVACNTCKYIFLNDQIQETKINKDLVDCSKRDNGLVSLTCPNQCNSKNTYTLGRWRQIGNIIIANFLQYATLQLYWD